MFYQFGDKIYETELKNADDSSLTTGFVSGTEIAAASLKLGFSPANIEACASMNKYFRSGVEVYGSYTFTELRIPAAASAAGKHCCVAIFIKRNTFIVVDVEDPDGIIKQKFMNAINRYPSSSVTTEKLICAFFDSLISNDIQFIERTGFQLSELEEDVVNNDTDKDFSLDILAAKKELLVMHSYYEQLLDITEALEENDNDVFPSDDLIYLSNITKKIVRLREDIDSLNNAAEHLQDAYQSSLDLKLNNSMKFFTVLTTVFFPLTIIVGWYGMNFDSMPEFHWKYGYLFVILLSGLTVGAFTLFAKVKKWF
ncbi:MAG: hypothetical protein J1E34_00530 [Oscillospiraceae bacterium]|nr:hypothetical protein [Oscillospiraceae bacterium]